LDDSRFDSLTKSLVANFGSRRHFVGALTAAVAGASLRLSGIDETEANKHKKKKKKKKKKTINTGPQTPTCIPNCNGRVCGPNGCGGNCGTCGGDRPVCLDGVCGVSVCPPNALFCVEPDEIFLCTPNCSCAIKTTGEGFCTNSVGCLANECDSDADCVDAGFPAGSACVNASGPKCNCAKGCAPPCPG
jgi:hypothetical protein